MNPLLKTAKVILVVFCMVLVDEEPKSVASPKYFSTWCVPRKIGKVNVARISCNNEALYCFLLVNL